MEYFIFNSSIPYFMRNGSFDTEYIMIFLPCDLLDSRQLCINTSHICHAAITSCPPLIGEIHQILSLPTAKKMRLKKKHFKDILTILLLYV